MPKYLLSKFWRDEKFWILRLFQEWLLRCLSSFLPGKCCFCFSSVEFPWGTGCEGFRLNLDRWLRCWGKSRKKKHALQRNYKSRSTSQRLRDVGLDWCRSVCTIRTDIFSEAKSILQKPLDFHEENVAFWCDVVILNSVLECLGKHLKKSKRQTEVIHTKNIPPPPKVDCKMPNYMVKWWWQPKSVGVGLYPFQGFPNKGGMTIPKYKEFDWP